MGQIGEGLGPNNAKVAHASNTQLSKAAVQCVADHMHRDTSNDGFSSFVAERTLLDHAWMIEMKYAFETKLTICQTRN
jgi:hypothetical protein